MTIHLLDNIHQKRAKFEMVAVLHYTLLVGVDPKTGEAVKAIHYESKNLSGVATYTHNVSKKLKAFTEAMDNAPAFMSD